MNIAIIGGGAAGFFSAINLKEMIPDCEVTIFESSHSALSKVLVSGGGRCNLTNSFEGVGELSQVYPRGHRLIKQVFRLFDYRDTVRWFESRGVRLVTQSDYCLFPASQQASQIVDTFLDLSHSLGVEVCYGHKVTRIDSTGLGFDISFADRALSSLHFDRVIVTVGGKPRSEGFSFLDSLSLKVSPPVPSLFSFNIPDDSITSLMGSVVDCASVSIVGMKYRGTGALLVTHWGISGPAVLRLSSYAARELSQSDYCATVSVNWVGQSNSQVVFDHLQQLVRDCGSRLVTNIRPFNIPTRLWNLLVEKAGIPSERRFSEIGTKGLNRLVNLLTNDQYRIGGRSRFREEFVTCGGVSLSQVNLSTMESRAYRGLYFAGEVLDVDALTGGFNLQGAWSMGYAAACSIANSIEKG
ncbi:MAG: NAD(P)/FAD-dependent oxidoreductase [Rikenellaceae bacterium]